VAAMFAFMLAATVSASAALDTAACAVCHHSFRVLANNLNETKTELERSKDFNDKKAQKVDKVQKAQTKRWLKNEYGVALRAGLEEELELLCSREYMTVSSGLKAACSKFLEDHEDDLPRAVLDSKEEEVYCAAAVTGCEGAAKKLALTEHQKQELKSEPVPKAKRALVRGCVTRLVGSTYSKGTRVASQTKHVLVLVHGLQAKATKSSGQVSSKRYAALLSEFYAFATATNSSAAGSGGDRFRFAQIDVSRNDLPNGTPLADPSGASILVYLRGEASSDPKSLPAVGETSLALAEAADVRSKLTQVLLTYLPKKDQALVRKVMQAREKEGEAGQVKGAPPTSPGASAGGSGGSGDGSGSGGGGGSMSSVAKPATPARRRTSSVSKEAEASRRSQRCDACALLVSELASALNHTKTELERSKEFNDKKAQKVDKVQKAQTKRWLKNEYRVELAAAVEERLEKACDEAALFEPLCKDDLRAGPWAGLGSGSSFDETACKKAGELRCKEVIEEHAEPLVRSALDEKGLAVCTKVLEGCDPKVELARAEGSDPAEREAVREDKDEV